jgi:hypothetical protein
MLGCSNLTMSEETARLQKHTLNPHMAAETGIKEFARNTLSPFVLLAAGEEFHEVLCLFVQYSLAFTTTPQMSN